MTSPDTSAPALTPLRLLNVFLARLPLMLVLPPVMAAALVIGTWLTRDFTAEASFLPNAASEAPSGLAGVAAQFGFSLGSSGGESVDFYASLLRSRDLLSDVLREDFHVAASRTGADTLDGRLLDLLGVDGETAADSVLAGVKRMNKLLSIRTDAGAGIVSLQFTAPWPALAEAVAESLLAAVNRFNVAKRQSRAAAERRFVEERLNQAQRDLNDAEARLERFHTENRSYRESARLQVEAARLQRRVDISQQVYLTLAQAYEQARIEEVRNTAVITIIDPATGSARPEMRLSYAGILGLILGATLAVVIAVAQAFADAQRRLHPEDASESSLLLRRFMHRLRSPLRGAP